MTENTIEMMVDIETLDTEDTAVIFQVGIVAFDKNHNILEKAEYNLNVQDQLDQGRTISADTLFFHLKQPKGIHDSMNHKHLIDPYSLHQFLSAFAEDVAKAHGKIYSWWAKGDFDFRLLGNLFEDFGTPWKFYQVRELRTMMRECGVDKGDVAHTALADCVAQVAQLAACRAKIQR